MHSFAILPAAGRSARMGQPKLLLPWGRSTIIGSVIEAWKSSETTRIVVVVHPTDHKLAEFCQSMGVEVLIPPTPPAEMKDSVQLGLRYVEQHFQPTGRDVWLLAPADMPKLSGSAINLVLASHRPHDPAILVPTAGGRNGHPVLFPWPLAKEVEQLPATGGVNQLLKLHPVRHIPCPDLGILCDVDTPEDFQRLQNS